MTKKEKELEEKDALTEEKNEVVASDEHTENDPVSEEQLSLEDVIKNLEKISDTYKEKVELTDVETPEDLSLDRKEEIIIDEDKIKEEVNESTKSEFDKKKQKLSEDAESEINAIEKSKQTHELSAETQKQTIDDTLNSQRIIAENDALKRGLARSSIVISKLGNIEDERASQLIKLSTSLENKLTSLESEIDKLNVKKDISLSNLDIELAQEIEKRIATKVGELKKAQDSVLEYNNKVKQLEAEYQVDRKKNMSDQKVKQYEFESKFGGDIKKQILAEKYDYVSKYLATMPKQEAITVLITTPDLAKQLGDAFYDLYYAQSRRQS